MSQYRISPFKPNSELLKFLKFFRKIFYNILTVIIWWYNIGTLNLEWSNGLPCIIMYLSFYIHILQCLPRVSIALISPKLDVMNSSKISWISFKM